MPKSVRSIIKKCLYKGAITQEEYDKIIRKLDSVEEDDLISRTELIRKLKHLEKFNNSDVPEWIWCAIGGTK